MKQSKKSCPQKQKAIYSWTFVCFNSVALLIFCCSYSNKIIAAENKQNLSVDKSVREVQEQKVYAKPEDADKTYINWYINKMLAEKNKTPASSAQSNKQQ